MKPLKVVNVCCAKINSQDRWSCGSTGRYGVNGQFCKMHAKRLSKEEQISAILDDEHRELDYVSDQIQYELEQIAKLQDRIDGCKLLIKELRDRKRRVTIGINRKTRALESSEYVPHDASVVTT